MTRKEPRPGEHYKSIDGTEIEIVLIATNADTHQKMVIYKNTTYENVFYAKTINSFMEKADTDQVYQFEKISDAQESISDKEALQEMIIHFLDLESSRDKILYLQKKHMEISDDFLSAISIGIDFVETKTDLEERYRDILNYLNTLKRYESR